MRLKGFCKTRDLDYEKTKQRLEDKWLYEMSPEIRTKLEVHKYLKKREKDFIKQNIKIQLNILNI
jgi:hypothetical protein